MRAGAFEGPITVTLDRPVMVGEVEITTLVFDELSIGDEIDYEVMLDGFEKPPTKAQAGRVSLFFMSRMTSQPETIIRAVKGRDYAKLQAAMDKILPPPPADALGNDQPA